MESKFEAHTDLTKLEFAKDNGGIVKKRNFVLSSSPPSSPSLLLNWMAFAITTRACLLTAREKWPLCLHTHYTNSDINLK